MDFLEFKKLYKRDEDYPERCFDMQMYRRVLDGELYDILTYPFCQRFKNSGASGQPIPLSQRRPSIRYNLCKVVVDQTTSLLFGEGLFPVLTIKDDENTKEILDEIITELRLDLVMMDAAIKGSVGSVALFLKVINGKIFVNAYCTEYLTPKYDPEDPDELSLITEKKKLEGCILIDEMGYTGLDRKEVYWWMRQWDSIEERYYKPWKPSEEEKENFRLTVDNERTVSHKLGFVPIIWIVNMPGKEGIDGLCTFRSGIDTNIELEYQLSQGGRGLKYSSEPLFLLKNPSLNMQGEISLGEGNTIEVDENGDGKFVEIDGSAIEGLLKFTDKLREIVLESTHGNRSSPDKVHIGQSGSAAKLFYLTLIWVAGKLRVTYGSGYLQLIKMIIKCNQKTELKYDQGGELITIPKGKLKTGLKIGLQWAKYFEATPGDRLQEAQSLTTLTGGEPLMTQETAIGSLAAEYDIVDIEKEKSDLQKLSEKKAKDAMALASVKKSDNKIRSKTA